MAVYVDLTKWQQADVADRCHYMPCIIKYSGETNAEKYFETTIQEDDDKKGMIVKEKKVPLSEEEDRQFSIVARVPQFTYWNLDKPITEEDKLAKALVFTEIARELHQREEVEEDDECKNDGSSSKD
ncbi:Hypothetical predicted protein [Octopus vulgaris]|uniref:Uncharacterized protein n=2 Tax=Octopus TaxID=6643 RepID=A0AA36ANS8_OCTVU|nr:uncharacterized protein LOC115209934 isoform X2 [Octopus sinensis]CAI9719575.1 Hypothetical predicted protein [Octopus vulgaris]